MPRLAILVLGFAALLAGCTVSSDVTFTAGDTATTTTSAEPEPAQLVQPELTGSGTTESESVDDTAAEVEPAAAESIESEAEPGSVKPDPSDGDDIDVDNFGPILELAQIAAYPEGGISYAYAVDHDRMYALAGVDPTTLCDDPSEWDATMSVLYYDHGVSATRFAHRTTEETVTDMHRSFGFVPCDISATLDLAAPNTLVRIDVRAETLVAAARADERHAELLVVTEDPGLTMLEWPSESIVARETSVMFPHAFSADPIATTGDTIIRSSAPAGIHAILDPERQRIAEIGNLRTPLQLLENENAYAIALTDVPYVSRQMPNLVELVESDLSSEEIMESLVDEATATPIGLAPWSVMMIGATSGETGSEAVLVLGYLNGDIAAESGERLLALVDTLGEPTGQDAPWRELVEITELWTHDRFLLARFSPLTTEVNPFALLNLEYQRLGPLLGVGHELAE